jgi:predicted O-methyltransferase YrrM
MPDDEGPSSENEMEHPPGRASQVRNLQMFHSRHRCTGQAQCATALRWWLCHRSTAGPHSEHAVAAQGSGASVNVPAASAKMPTVHQAAFHKYRLLLKLMFSRPAEFYDRVKTKAEGMVSSPQSGAAANGLDLAAMIHRSEQYLGLDLNGFRHEPAAVEIRGHIAASRARLNRPAEAAMHDADDGLPDFCYVTCRALRPRVVVETGVGSGVTTAFILQALAANGEGHLWSIDLPPVGAEEFAGSFVPQHLRSRWTLLRGRTRDLLPPLLRDLPVPDVFLHDSLHTTRNMTFEFNAAWQKMAAGGILLSDDIHMSKAFARFITGNQVGLSLVGTRFGVAIKR